MRNFLVLAQGKPAVVQVLLAIHSSFTDANCVAVCVRGTRFLRSSNLCSKYMEVDFQGKDDDKFVESINLFSQTMPDLILIPADCPGIRMLNRVRHRLNTRVIPSPNSSMLDRLENKWDFYQLCSEHGLNVPVARLIDSKLNLDFPLIAKEIGVPFVIKPVDQKGSEGIHVVSNEAEYDHKIRNNPGYEYSPLIVQRYIRGTDVGLNFLAVHGNVIAIAVQQPVDQHRVASGIKFLSNDYLENVAYVLSAILRYHGVINIDARIENGTGKVFLFEGNPRFWRTLLASAWCGLDFVAESIEPSLQTDAVRMLTSGVAKTYYHPLFYPHLWRYGLFDSGPRGRMVRTMMCDVSTLLTSTKTFFLDCVGHRSQRTVASIPIHASLLEP